jgi:hypothetical protein
MRKCDYNFDWASTCVVVCYVRDSGSKRIEFTISYYSCCALLIDQHTIPNNKMHKKAFVGLVLYVEFTILARPIRIPFDIECRKRDASSCVTSTELQAFIRCLCLFHETVCT